jgi:phosphoribosyl 1,2-cyclic phosphate phosphodiesterase
MRITILGCGSALGVPMVGFGWGDCDQRNPRNYRLRSSIFIEHEDDSLLIDTSPDLRQQLLTNDIRKIDAVLYTHHHADHVHGIEELREINRIMNAPMQVYGTHETLTEIKRKFAYAFESLETARLSESPYWLSHTWLESNVINPGKKFKIGKQCNIEAIDADHGTMRVTGYKIGKFAYLTDEVNIPDESLEKLKGLKVLILGCVTTRPFPSHAHLEKVLAWVRVLKPEMTYLTHMGPRLDYDTLCGNLPINIRPSYDGLKIAI